MKKRVHIFASGPRAGERLPYVINDGGEIDAHILAYSTNRRHKTPKTREKALDAVVALRLWAKASGINVEQLMFHGECLSTDQIESLKYYVHLKTIELRVLAHARPLDVNKWLDRAERCAPEAVVIRKHYVFDYLYFLGHWGNRFLIKTRADETLLAHRRMRLSPPVKHGKTSKRTYTPGSIAGELMADLASPMPSRIDRTSTSTLNKFKIWLAAVDLSKIWPNEARAARNRVLLDVLSKNGGRVGEVLQIKNEDIDLERRGIRIVRRHNDPEDPRSDEPNAKTRDRLLRFDRRSWQDLQTWFGIHFDLTEATDTQFLFVSCSRDPRYAGRPMTARGVREQVYEACDYASLPRLRAHDLRHGSVRDLAEEAVHQGWTHEQWRKVATYLYGWSDQSGMPSHYVGDQWVMHAEATMAKVWSDREAAAIALREDFVP